MKARVDEDLCIGCGICEDIAPEVFSLEHEPTAQVIMNPVEADFQEVVRQAAENCPEEAIEVNDEAETPVDDETTTEVPGGTEVEEIDPILVSERNEGMRANVDPDLCIGCGICEGIVPEVFSMLNEPYAEVLLDPIPAEFEDAVREAAEECPEEAISITE